MACTRRVSKISDGILGKCICVGLLPDKIFLRGTSSRIESRSIRSPNRDTFDLPTLGHQPSVLSFFIGAGDPLLNAPITLKMKMERESGVEKV